MPRARSQAIASAGTPDDVEASFYEAMQAGDLERLMACWSDEDDIVCVHPGGPRVVGLAAIRATFEAIFSNGSIRAFPEQVRKVEAMGSAVHSLIERVEVMTDAGPTRAYVLATNVFHKGPLGWRMVAHHASAAAQDALQIIPALPQTLH